MNECICGPFQPPHDAECPFSSQQTQTHAASFAQGMAFGTTRIIPDIADPMPMTTLTEFLLARIAEDEEVARYAATRARSMAECEAKRRLLIFVLEHGAAIDGEYGCCHDAEALLAGGRGPYFDGDEFDPLPHDCPGIKAAMPGLYLLALPYAAHPDFDESWRP